MVGISDRITLIIKNSGLTKTKFAEKLNLSQPFVSKIANGLAIPSDRTIADICREFNVNENWLRTGEGEMFLRLNNDEEFELICEYIRVKDPIIKEILLSYWRLPDEQKAGVKEFIRDVAKGISGLDT